MEFFCMFKTINLGNEKSSLEALVAMKENKFTDYDVRITNSHINNLNSVLGKKVFRKDALYIGSDTLWEIMQPIGSKGRHNFHGLTPEDVYNALLTMKYSKEVDVSYDNRYLIVTLATVFDDVNLVVIVTPEGSLKNESKTIVNRIITIYPKNKK